MSRRRCSRAPARKSTASASPASAKSSSTGAERGRPPIEQVGPQGCPVIPATSGGISALLNSAPELIDRIQRLTERLTELLSDKNQNSIADILENIDATTKVLREHAPEMGDTIARSASRRTTPASRRNNVAALADNTNRLVTEQGRPAARTSQGDRLGPAGGGQSQRDDHRRPAGRAEFQQVDAARGQQAGPRPARPVAVAPAVSNRVNQQGIGGALGPEKLPDYKPGKRK